ncbi:MAG TPA: deoxynucleoside kinase [Clostridiales bacterium]|nr:deoxynucleoside kinase [Clostridiales bacterium]
MQGKLIVLEGIDGSGKSTQYRLLCDRLLREKIEFRNIIFPRYDKESSALLRMYLKGEFGEKPSDVSAYASSTFFAVDRYASYKTDWGSYYNEGGLILSDRYTTSNAVHQGSKVPPGELQPFLDWLYDFEFRLLELPKPDLVIYMDVDIETAVAMMALRQHETKTKSDIHETDINYLKNCLLAGSFAADYYGWKRISCISGSGMRQAEDIHEEIFKTIMEVL